jgi:hypothetical protein
MDLLEIGWGGVDWIGLAQERQVESSCECGYEPSGSIKCWETIKWLHNLWPLKFHRVSSCNKNSCSQSGDTWQTEEIGLCRCDLGLLSHLSQRQLQ